MEPKELEVVIDPIAQEKINHWIKLSPIEISGMGKVVKGEGYLYVTDVFLVEQENSSGDTEMKADELAKLQFETKGIEGSLNFWWHSHVNMGVFWSGTDKKAIHQLGKNGWILSTVFNKKGESKSSFYQGNADSFYPSVFIDDLKTRVGTCISNPNFYEELEKEYKTKCKKKTYNYEGRGSLTKRGRNKTLLTDSIEGIPIHVGKPMTKKQIRKKCNIPDSDFDAWWLAYYEDIGETPKSVDQLNTYHKYWTNNTYKTSTELEDDALYEQMYQEQMGKYNQQCLSNWIGGYNG